MNVLIPIVSFISMILVLIDAKPKPLWFILWALFTGYMILI